MLNGGSQSLPQVEGVGRIKAVGLRLLTPLPGPGAKPSRNLLYQRPPLRTLAIIPANPPMLYQPQFKSLCQTQEVRYTVELGDKELFGQPKIVP